MEQQLVTELADDRGMVDVTVDKPSVALDMEFNIRDDDLQMFEADGGRLMLRTSEMPDGVYVEPVPSPSGVQSHVAVGIDAATLTPVEPAEPFTPEVEDATTTLDVRVD